jgi:hypothetical protein
VDLRLQRDLLFVEMLMLTGAIDDFMEFNVQFGSQLFDDAVFRVLVHCIDHSLHLIQFGRIRDLIAG